MHVASFILTELLMDWKAYAEYIWLCLFLSFAGFCQILSFRVCKEGTLYGYYVEI